ncbi:MULTISPECIES: hypothetical protein [Idiomarina]|uniref:hypothetical protein n=1 Tax=Idiomarina TaxID=135575 RepID=UPI002355207C|nr:MULTISPECIES: hypothetical protein [Idiomarina]
MNRSNLRVAVKVSITIYEHYFVSNDMSKLANQLFLASAISAQQRNRMGFHMAKTDQQNTLMSEPEQIDPDEPINFVKHWQDRVKANEHFDASPQEKALAQGALDVLRQV